MSSKNTVPEVAETAGIPIISVWDRVAQDYTSDIDSGERKLAKEISAVLRAKGVLPNAKLLELGSGSGHLSACLAMEGYQTVLLDFSEEALKKSREVYEKYGLSGEFVRADIMSLDDLADNDFDIVWNSGVMEHFSGSTICDAFENIKKIAHKKLLILVPNSRSISYLLMRYIRMSQNDWPYGEEYLRINYASLIKSIGFPNVEVSYCAKDATKYNFWVAMKDATYSDAYTELIDRNLLPSEENYLVAYYAEKSSCFDDDTYGETGKSLSSVNAADYVTALFNLDAERYGLLKNNRTLSSERDNLARELAQTQEQCRRLLKDLDQLQADQNQTKVELDQTREELYRKQVERDQMQVERDQMQVKRDQMRAERDQMQVERGKMQAEKDQVQAERDQMRAERDQMQIERDQVGAALDQDRNTIIKTRMLVSNLMAARTSKLLHLWIRFRRQFLGGGHQGRKEFFRWLNMRKSGGIVNREEYSPFMRVYNSLVSSELSTASCSVASSEITIDTAVLEQLSLPYKKHDVIILSIIDYNFRHQRPQHFADRFAKQGHRVFYVNANFHKQEHIEQECALQNLNSVYFSNEKFSAIYYTDWSNIQIQLQEKIDNLLNNEAIRDAIVLVDYPNWIYAAQYLRSKYGFKIFTDYMDDFTGFINTTEDLLKRNCEELLSVSDGVIASSQFLYDVANTYNPNTVIIRNGAEHSHFKKAFNPTTDNKRKIVGYYGAVAEWFDAGLVGFLAEMLTDCDFVIIGEVSANREILLAHGNIRLLGEQPYDKLPGYLRNFDVCLIPFDTSTDLIKATNPVKFYEYLSAGKKIVATAIPELEPFRDKYVYMTNDRQEFLEYVKLCLNGEDSLQPAEELMLMGKKNDWNERFVAFTDFYRGCVPMASIIVLTYNCLEYTKACIESIFQNTAYPRYELIIVDNGSTDDTREYLQELQQNGHSNLKVILNDENLGFAAGNNVGIKNAVGDYIILLNNDTLVTRGWLTGLVKHEENNPSVGLCGPVTNSIGNEAKIRAYYNSRQELANFAYNYTTRHMGEQYPLEPNVLAMFCVAVRRDVLVTCGLLDEDYSVGMFEDDDYACKAKQAGYQLCIAEDSYVHHFLNVSFKQLSNAKNINIFKNNKEVFNEKWRKKGIYWTPHQFREGVDSNTNNDLDYSRLL